jgi:hypothetical protein
MKIKKDIDGNCSMVLNYEILVFPSNYTKASPLTLPKLELL